MNITAVLSLVGLALVSGPFRSDFAAFRAHGDTGWVRMGFGRGDLSAPKVIPGTRLQNGLGLLSNCACWL